MRKLRIPVPLADMWRPLLVFLVCLAFVGSLLTFRLGSLTPGFATSEIEQRNTTKTAKSIVENPLYLKQKIGHYAVQKTGHDSPTALRLWNSIFGLLFAICMFIILKNWHTTRIAFLGTLLFVTSSWYLHTVRLASVDIAFLMPLLLIVGGIWLQAKKHTLIATLTTVGAAVTMLYVPAMVLLVLPTIIWQRRILRSTIHSLSIWWRIGISLIVLIGIAPLVWGLAKNPSLIKTWLGMPATFPEPMTFLQNLIDIPLNMFVRGNGDPIYTIANLPLLDIFTSIMVVLGVFAYLFRLRLDRTKLVFGVGLIGSLLIALDGPVRISFLLPIVYVVAAAGMTLMLQQWFTVFPRNPFARTVSVILITASIVLASFYHLNRYFVAWPNVPATKAVFTHKP